MRYAPSSLGAEFKSCLPAEIAESGKIAKLLKFFVTGSIRPGGANGRPGIPPRPADVQRQLKQLDRQLQAKQNKKPDQQEAIIKRMVECFNPAGAPSAALDVKEAILEIASTKSWDNLASSPKFLALGELAFERNCLGPTFFERVAGSEETMFEKEMETLTTCINKKKSVVAGKDPATLEGMTKIVFECIPVPARGISREFLYRSLYAVQIFECLKSVPKEVSERSERALRKSREYRATTKLN